MSKLAMKKYRARDVSTAVGLSEDTIYSYFSNKGESAKGGITILQIVDLLEAPRRHKSIEPPDMETVAEIRAALIPFGFTESDLTKD